MTDVWEFAANVLERCAWIDGEPCRWHSLELDPDALEAFCRCVDAVSKLPRDGRRGGVQRRLRLTFGNVATEAAGSDNGRNVWRWTNPPSVPWVTRNDIAELRSRAGDAENRQAENSDTGKTSREPSPERETWKQRRVRTGELIRDQLTAIYANDRTAEGLLSSQLADILECSARAVRKCEPYKRARASAEHKCRTGRI